MSFGVNLKPSHTSWQAAAGGNSSMQDIQYIVYRLGYKDFN